MPWDNIHKPWGNNRSPHCKVGYDVPITDQVLPRNVIEVLPNLQDADPPTASDGLPQDEATKRKWLQARMKFENKKPRSEGSRSPSSDDALSETNSNSFSGTFLSRAPPPPRYNIPETAPSSSQAPQSKRSYTMCSGQMSTIGFTASANGSTCAPSDAEFADDNSSIARGLLGFGVRANREDDDDGSGNETVVTTSTNTLMVVFCLKANLTELNL